LYSDELKRPAIIVYNKSARLSGYAPKNNFDIAYYIIEEKAFYFSYYRNPTTGNIQPDPYELACKLECKHPLRR